MKKTFTITDEHIGLRVDKFLAQMLPEFSRAEIQRFEKNFDNSRKLKANDVVIVVISATSSPRDNRDNHITYHDYHERSDITIDIIYEDDDIIAVNKPRGMVMYPAVGNTSGTLVQELLRYCPLSALGGDTRPGVVHRIDKDTSGVVVLAKTDAAFRQLVKTFAAHDLTRRYIAFVWGIPHWEEATIEGNIARSVKNRQKMSMVKVGGRPAKTDIRVKNIWTKAQVSEFICTLHTGRTHQIRVHLSSHGFPVLTDPTYGKGKDTRIKPSDLLEFLRNHDGQCLHAEVLELAHPVTGAPLKLRAPLPPDLVELRECLDSY